MTAVTAPIGARDSVYYWDASICFSVEGILFKVPRYPFIVGSGYFTEKYHLQSVDDNGAENNNVVHLDGISAAQFRVFLKLLLPLHSNSVTLHFTKEEWLTILRLSTLWHFHEFRKLAIHHLADQLTELELIHVGRASYHPRWVLKGYKALIERPRPDIITEEEASAIGHEAANKLWIIRYQRNVSGATPFAAFVDSAKLRSRFAKELADLEAGESEHCTEAEVQELAQQEEEARRSKEVAGAMKKVPEPAKSVAEWTEPQKVPGEVIEQRVDEGLKPKEPTSEAVSLDERCESKAVGVEEQVEMDERNAELQKKLDEKKRIKQLKEAQLANRAKLIQQEKDTSDKLRRTEQLLRNPGNCKSKTIEKRERKVKRLTAKLPKLTQEIKDVEALLKVLNSEEEKLTV